MRPFLPMLLLAMSCGGPEPPAPGPEPRAEASATGEASSPAPVRDSSGSDELQPEPVATVELPPRPEGDPFGGFVMFREVELDQDLPWKHAGTLEDPVPVNLDFLGAWEFDETMEEVFPPGVQALAGRKVVIRGFMLPSVDFQDIREFHLVRSLWGCCFGAPPRINEIVRVNLPEGVDYTYDGLEVVGTLRTVYETEDGIAEDLYRLQADSMRELDRYEDPEAPEDFDPASARGILLGSDEEF